MDLAKIKEAYSNLYFGEHIQVNKDKSTGEIWVDGRLQTGDWIKYDRGVVFTDICYNDLDLQSEDVDNEIEEILGRELQ